MKEFEVTVRLRNNRLKQRRLELGLTQHEMAKVSGCSVRVYCGFESLTISPFTLDGEWKPGAVSLANFHCVKPRELFPEAAVAVTQSTSVRRLSTDEIGLFLGAGSRPELPEDAQASTELRESVTEILKTLPTKEAFVIARRFGIDDDEERSTAEIAMMLERTGQTVRQLEKSALQKLRHPSRSNQLKGYRTFLEKPQVVSARQAPSYFGYTELRAKFLREASAKDGFRFVYWSKGVDQDVKLEQRARELRDIGLITIRQENKADEGDPHRYSEMAWVCTITPEGAKFLLEERDILLNTGPEPDVLDVEEVL